MSIHSLSLFLLASPRLCVSVCLGAISTHKVPTESYLSQLSWQDSPIYSEIQTEKQPSQPEPPSPTPGQRPLQIVDLWEQYSDPATGRCYYVNSVTKERSWKPPRRSRGHASSKVYHLTQQVLLNQHFASTQIARNLKRSAFSTAFFLPQWTA